MLFALGRGGRPLKSLLAPKLKLSCWIEREYVFLGVVGGAGVRLNSLPFSDDETLLEELAPLESM